MAAQTLNHRARRGFTLVELLLVLGIIILLAAIVIPSVNRARTMAARTRMAMDLSTIEQALDAFKADHGDYPRVLGAPMAARKGYDGAVALCQALLAPGDVDDLDDDDGNNNKLTGAEVPALGLRKRDGGKMYGPYLRSEDFKADYPPRDPAAPTPTDPPSEYCLYDRFERPILYFPASAAKPNIRQTPASGAKPPYVADSDVESFYDYRDNFTAVEPPPGHFGPFGRPAPQSDTEARQRIQLMLGERTLDGVIQGNETPVEKPFLLWSAGPDQIYGPELLNEDYARRCDDVTNFRE